MNIQGEKKSRHSFSPFPDNIELKFLELMENPILCPLCNSKLKKTKVIEKEEIFSQTFKCKNKKCDFHKEITIKI